tara:strand:+ start:1176 stop:1922 length:747 start_codon:yes stop_codon:yes gene_type:complete
MVEEFKIYVVNLKRDEERRKNIINEIEKQNIKNYEIIDAVDGNELNEYELDTLTFKNKKKFNQWNSKMSPSQIGCALSHIKIYKKFINTDFKLAFILEDDAIFLKNFEIKIKKFILKNFKYKKQIMLLSELKEFYPKAIDTNDGYEIVNVSNAFFTHGYIINREAAKSIVSFNFPVKTVADNFVFFKIYCGVKITGLNPFLLKQDTINFKSSIIWGKRDKKVFLIRRSFYKIKNKILKKFINFKTHKN